MMDRIGEDRNKAKKRKKPQKSYSRAMYKAMEKFVEGEREVDNTKLVQ